MKLQENARLLLVAAGLTLGLATFAGCDNEPDTPGEALDRAAENVEDAADEAGDRIEDAADKAEDKIDDATD